MIFIGSYTSLVILMFCAFVWYVFGEWGLVTAVALILLISRRH